jgi:hypothetical protein
VCSVVLFNSLTWEVCVRLFCSIVWRGAIEQNNRTTEHTSHVKLLNKTTEHTPPTSNYWTKQPNTHLPRQTMEQNNDVGGVCLVVLFNSLTWKACVRLFCSIVWRGRCVFGCFVQLFDLVGVCSVVLFHSLKWKVCVNGTHTYQVKLLNKTTEHTPPTLNYGTKQPNTHLPRQTIEQNNRTHGCFVQ